MVDFVNLERQWAEIKKEAEKRVSKVFETGHYVLGEEGKKFEEEFSDYCGAGYGIGTANGTEALQLCLMAEKIEQGDEVILPSFTATPTALAVVLAGAKPVFADIEEDSFLINCEEVKKLVGEKTKAIIPVHLYGQMADMNGIKEIAEKHSLTVIEDACQAHGAEFKGKKAGSIGDYGCFSFYPTKNLGAAGDGGMIVTSDKNKAEVLEKMRNMGQKNRYENEVTGLNSRLDEVQASLLRVKLEHLDKWNEKRIELAGIYESGIENKCIAAKPFGKYGKHVYHMYVVRCRERDALKKFLEEKKIPSIIHYPIAVHQQKAFSEYGGESLLETEKAVKEVLSIPLCPQHTEEEISEVVQAINRFRK